MDYFNEVGNLAFASRMKRLTSRLYKDASEIYRSQGIDFEPKWFPIFHLLSISKKKMTITDIAKALDLTHPAIIKMSKDMVNTGLLVSAKDKKDKRKHMLSISQKGNVILKDLLPVWQSVESALEEFLTEIEYDILDVIGKMEMALDRKSISERAIISLKQSQKNSIVIVGYSPDFKKYFMELNYEWLERFFSIEEHDRLILQNPESEIINSGGHILFAKYKEQVIGTCALIKLNQSTYELSKMAVTEKFQGLQVGSRLMEEAITLVQKCNGSHIYLKTDKKLAKAMKLYRKYGFRISNQHPFEIQSTEREKSAVIMELTLKD